VKGILVLMVAIAAFTILGGWCQMRQPYFQRGGQ
jgi:hypothetical protein